MAKSFDSLLGDLVDSLGLKKLLATFSWQNTSVVTLVVLFLSLYWWYVDKFERKETKKKVLHYAFGAISILCPFLKFLDIYSNGFGDNWVRWTVTLVASFIPAGVVWGTGLLLQPKDSQNKVPADPDPKTGEKVNETESPKAEVPADPGHGKSGNETKNESPSAKVDPPRPKDDVRKGSDSMGSVTSSTTLDDVRKSSGSNGSVVPASGLPDENHVGRPAEPVTRMADLDVMAKEKVSPRDLLDVAKEIQADWDKVALHLDTRTFNEGRIKVIRKEHSLDGQLIQANSMLQQWTSKYDSQATKSQLILAVVNAGLKAEAIKVFGRELVDHVVKPTQR